MNWYDERKKAGRCVTWSCRRKALDGRVRCSKHLSCASAHVQVVHVSNTALAYLAGIVDGEGCIAVYRHACKRGSKVWYAYAARVVVVNTSMRLLRLFKKYFRGSIHPRNNKKGRPCFSWHIGHRSALAFLVRMLPYLLVKKKQARLVIRCQSMNDKRRSFFETEKVRMLQRRLANRIKELKHASD